MFDNINQDYVVIFLIVALCIFMYTKKENFAVDSTNKQPLDLTNRHSLCPAASDKKSPKCIDGVALGTGTCYYGGRTVNISLVPSTEIPAGSNPQNYYRCTNPGNPFNKLGACPPNSDINGVNTNQCFCKPGFEISADKKNCNCPAFHQLSNGQCLFKPFSVNTLDDLRNINSVYNNQVARA